MPNQHSPTWLPKELYPFQSRHLQVGQAVVHYIDEGSGPTLLLLHGNPSWSFLYREIIKGLRGDFRCVALDYPGFGLSVPPPGYGFTPAEHAEVVHRFVQQLDLRAVTMMVQDWGEPTVDGVPLSGYPLEVKRAHPGFCRAPVRVPTRLNVISMSGSAEKSGRKTLRGS